MILYLHIGMSWIVKDHVTEFYIALKFIEHSSLFRTGINEWFLKGIIL